MPVDPKALILLDFRHKKRRPWTSLDDQMGRGNLNWNAMILICIVKKRFYLFLEYLLEYRSLGFLNFHLHDASGGGASTAVLQIELSSAVIGYHLFVIDLQLA